MARSNGYNTKTRQRILQYLIAQKEHAVSASDIVEYLEDTGDSPSSTTVYRYLERLSVEGSVIKYVADKGEKALFQYIGNDISCHSHLHLKCIGCGKIYHLDCSFMEDVSNHLLRKHGFALQCESSILYGTCLQCRLAAGEKPKVPFPIEID